MRESCVENFIELQPLESTNKSIHMFYGKLRKKDISILEPFNSQFQTVLKPERIQILLRVLSISIQKPMKQNNRSECKPMI